MLNDSQKVFVQVLCEGKMRVSHIWEKDTGFKIWRSPSLFTTTVGLILTNSEPQFAHCQIGDDGHLNIWWRIKLLINNVHMIKREILLYMCDKEKCLCDSIYLWKWGVPVSAPECKASAEKKRASQAVRQEKGNLLEGKERVTGS